MQLPSIHPRIAMAVKCALAAAVAWLLVQPLHGVADTYPYYAPLGAVIAVTTTVIGSVRESVQGVTAILLGAAIAITVDAALPANAATLAIVVLIGVLLAGWDRLGSMAAWVPISALFVLIIGHANPLTYALAYSGLTCLGAAVGVGVNLLFPPLPVALTQARIDRLRVALADHLAALADGIRQDGPPTPQAWAERQQAMEPIEPLVGRMRAMVAQTREARKGNLRAGRRYPELHRQYEEAAALERVAALVEDLTIVVTDRERSDRSRVALGPALRPTAARALEASAAALRSGSGADARARVEEAERAVASLAERVRDGQNLAAAEPFAAASIVLTLRRALDSLHPVHG